MKVEEIERLLAEFYEGNTNEQEEELLKEAFRTEEVPEHLQKDKKLFLSFFPGEVVDNVPAGLEDKLSRMIDEKADEEQRFFHRNKAKRNWRWDRRYCCHHSGSCRCRLWHYEHGRGYASSYTSGHFL